MSKILAWVLMAAATAFAAPDGPRAAETGVEGKYVPIQPARPLEQNEDKVEVVDVFWYGCPHCFNFLPYLQRWESERPDYVELRRVPAIFRESWKPHARAYYTAQMLGLEDELHVPIFNALHVDKRPLNTKEELMAFFAEHGVDRQEFSETWDSFSVDALTREAGVTVRRWGVRGTPSVVVNGRYLVSGTTAGSYSEAIRVIEALVEHERKVMASRESS